MILIYRRIHQNFVSLMKINWHVIKVEYCRPPNWFMVVLERWFPNSAYGIWRTWNYSIPDRWNTLDSSTFLEWSQMTKTFIRSSKPFLKLETKWVGVPRCGQSVSLHFLWFIFLFNHFILGMAIEKSLFIKHCSDRQLESEMRNAKKDFSKLQIIFVIINRKGDPAYG